MEFVRFEVRLDYLYLVGPQDTPEESVAHGNRMAHLSNRLGRAIEPRPTSCTRLARPLFAGETLTSGIGETKTPPASPSAPLGLYGMRSRHAEHERVPDPNR
jgi:hypothetical protein